MKLLSTYLLPKLLATVSITTLLRILVSFWLSHILVYLFHLCSSLDGDT